MSLTSDYQFYTKPQYFAQLVKDIGQAKRGDRVLVAAMNFEPDIPAVAAIVDALCTAAQRGVKASLAFDAYNFLMIGALRPGPLWLHADFPKRLDRTSQQLLATVERLQAAGATVGITNQPHRAHSMPFAGRSHIKAAIINDKIYLGGCNFNNATELDLMTSWHDIKTADWLYTHLQTMATTESTRTAFGTDDQRYKVDDSTTIFIDAGVKHQSLIFEQALACIDAAKEWLLITCQYFPHSVTADHLARAARRGVKVRLLYNSPLKHHAHAPMQQAVVWRERLRGLPKSFFAGSLPLRNGYIHAKLIATEQGAMLGSHNYVTQGVDFGTAEIALLCHDPAFAQAAAQTILRQITA